MWHWTWVVASLHIVVDWNQGPEAVTYFHKLDSISQWLHGIPKQCHHLRNMCSGHEPIGNILDLSHNKQEPCLSPADIMKILDSGAFLF